MSKSGYKRPTMRQYNLELLRRFRPVRDHADVVLPYELLLESSFVLQAAYAWADQLTREQAAALFYRFAKLMGKA